MVTKTLKDREAVFAQLDKRLKEIIFSYTHDNKA